MTKKTKLIRKNVPIDKLVTMAEMGLGVVRPLNKEKRYWINKLAKEGVPYNPILVTPIKDSGYYLLTDGWHRVQAAKKNKILRDIDRDYGFRLKCSDLPQQWATFCDADND